MSIIIRQQLKPLLAAISLDVGNGAELELLPDDLSSLEPISVMAENLSRRLTRAQELLREWTLILSCPDKDVRAEENVLFADFLPGGKSPGDIIGIGLEAQTKLDLKIDRIRSRTSQAPPLATHPAPPAVRPLINLPALQLPDFDGHEGNWPSFWAAFSHTIHDNPSLPGAQKLTYLIGRLRGNARTLVDGFSLTDDNYPIVVNLLRGRYGDDDKRADRLRSELFHLAKPTGHSNSLRNFSENVDRICRQLESLGNNLDNNPFLTVAIKEKLPTEVKAQLYDKEMEEGRPWSSKEWRERLVRIVRLKEAVHAPWENTPGPVHLHSPKPQSRPHEPISRAFPVVTEVRKRNGHRNCSLCLQDGHPPSNCIVYRSAEQRRARLVEQGRCLLCAHEGHRQDNCSSTTRCYRCGGRHHVFVCPGSDRVPVRGSNSVPLGSRVSTTGNLTVGRTSQIPPSIAPLNGQQPPAQIASAVAENDASLHFIEFNSEARNRSTAYLMIKEIQVFSNKGSAPVTVPVFFDPGSQPDFITSNLVSLINPKWVKDENMAVRGFSGSAPPKMLQFPSPRFSVRLRRRDGGWETVELNQTAKIVPPVEFMTEVCWKPSEIPRMGVAVKEPQILLGVREFWKFFLGKREILPGLFRIDTVFGPIFGGEITNYTLPLAPVITPNPSLACGAVVMANKPDELIKQLWSLESIGISDPLDPNDEALASALFKNTVAFKDGRYEVGWPWRPGGKDRLSNNFSLAYSRLSALSVKLRANPEFREKYQDTIADQLVRGIIEPSTQTGAKEHFIPHHAVVSPKKLRVVYDASAHEKGKASLNELLLPGPNLVPELAGILLRFRASAHPVLGDIEKAFLAVGLKEEDREVAKFLWLKDPSRPLNPDNLVIYRFKRIAFGVNSSPFLLASVLRHHLSSKGDTLGMARNFYVDNLLLCSETTNEAAQSVQVARQMMSNAGMRLREFVAADPSILSSLPHDEVLVGDVQKVLGVSWNLPRDELFFELPNPNDFPPTRRGILSAIASLFDPLGLCCPCLVKAKIFFQSLWDLGKGWDEPIGEAHEKTWAEITSEWAGPTLAFTRPTPTSQATLQLHVFSDAGPNAFATAVYLRAEHNGCFKISLLFSKSRLRPKRLKNDGMTIPRLELLGLIVAVRAKNFVVANFDRTFDKIFFWVDSQIVLSWLASPAPQPVFIANRLLEIRQEKKAIFRYVRSADNPADLGTRGVSRNELDKLGLWHYGPGWLKNSERDWPNEFRDIVLPPDAPNDIEGNPIPVSVPIVEPPQDPFLLNPRHFHSWFNLLMTTTFVLIFLYRIFGKSERCKITLPFLTKLKGVEPTSFAARLVAKIWLLKREQIEMSAGNDTFTGDDGLIRLRTRLAYAQQPDDFKNPIVLPRESWVTRLLILSAHRSLAHAGVDFTLSKFLSEFWCPRARRLVKNVLRDCPICKKDKAVKFALPPMPPFPPARATLSSPFTFVGLDYLGPTLFKSLEGPKKAWILLFTCLSCRAMHLELVDSLSAVDFISAFRRFIARRGIPKRVWSDNGTQIVLGRQLLMAYYEYPVEWTLIPPHSPWAGGVYERMVGLVKTAFRRCLGRLTPTWVQLLTLTCEVEAILNSRPITFVSDERDGPLPLRPVDFLSPHSRNNLTEPDEPDKPFQPSSSEKLAHLWYVTNESLRRFWKQWSREYLLILRGRTKDTHAGPRVYAPDPPKIGDIVLVEQEDFPRNHWPLGRILALLPPDKPRSAKLLTGGRELVRPVNQLVPLEGAPEWREVPDRTPPGAVNGSASAKGLGERREVVRHYKWAERPPLPEVRRPEREKGTPLGLKWAKNPPLAAFLLSVLVLIQGASAAPRVVTCTEQGVWIFLNPKSENALICCEGICSSRGYSTPYLLPLPPDLLVSGFECHISYSLAGERVSSQTQCEPVEGCNLIKCYFCWERILNPHCSPFLLPFVLGTIAGAAGILLFICIMWALNRGGIGGYCLDRWTTYRRRRPRRERPELAVQWRRTPIIREDSDEGSQLSIHSGNSLGARLGLGPSGTRGALEDAPQPQSPGNETSRPRRLTRLGYALAPPFIGFLIAYLWVSSVNAGLEVVSISADTEECTVDYGGTTCRFDSVSSLTLLPVGQRVELVFHTPHAEPMGSLFFTLRELSLQCVKETRAWTRSYRINISSILRCPAAGSCTGSFCSDLEPHQSVPELREDFPGLNFCREASGFIRRGCLSPAYACLFYRIFAQPTAPYVYELFKCPTWQFHLRLGLTLEIKGSSYSEEVGLIPGITHHWPTANLSITFAPSGLPPLPLLGGHFVANRTHAALAPEWYTHLWCGTELSAAHLNCTLKPEVCHSCYTHHDAAVVQCHCRRQYDLEAAMRSPLLRLPNSLGHLQVGYGDERVWSSFPYAPVNLIVKMDSTRLAVQHSSSKCTISPGLLLGCHSCRTGGRFNYTCSSSRGESFASIDCADGTTWVTRCTPKGHANSVVLSWSYPVVKTRCQVDCLGEKTNFELEGILIFFVARGEDYSSISSTRGGKGTYAEGVTFPQVQLAIFQSVGSLPHAFFAFAVGIAWLLLFLLVFRFCPMLGLATCCPQAAAGVVLARTAGDRSCPRKVRDQRKYDRARTM